jgi:hypothetical protein
MSDDRPRRGTRGSRRSAARSQQGSVGQPNRLSDAATPNRLSGESTPATGALAGTRQGALAAPGGTVLASQRRRQIPSLSTLLFLGFVALTAIRLVGAAMEDAMPATPAPTTVNPGRSESPEPGAITFGTGSDGDCGVVEAAVRFDAGTDVWWSAELATEQPPSADAVVIVLRNGVQVDREYVAPDDSVGVWSILCSTVPVAQKIGGTYRVEVWDGDMTVLHAAGEYELATGPA